MFACFVEKAITEYYGVLGIECQQASADKLAEQWSAVPMFTVHGNDFARCPIPGMLSRTRIWEPRMSSARVFCKGCKDVGTVPYMKTGFQDASPG